MNDMTFCVPALLLSLFCLAYSIIARCGLYFPLPKGFSARLRNQHTVFLALLCVLTIAAAFGIAEAIVGTGRPDSVRIAGFVLRIMLLGLFALYTRALPKEERRASVLLVTAAVIGILIRLLWSAPVDLFFAAISAFGCMVMLERCEDAPETGMDVQSCSETLLDAQEKETQKKGEQGGSSIPSRRIRSGVFATLLVTLVIVTVFCVYISAGWGNSRLSREADRYENQLNEWITEQTSILTMFTDTISAQPEIMDDYETAVHWLDSIAAHYPSISACYMANPYAEIPVIMNTGWMPGEDERPETRPWYRATERAANHFNISAPYLDAQTGNYCITFSRVVYGENNEFLGIFGIDFFLDKLIQVLGESYTSKSYAFLVDSDGVIINHPNKAYENDSGAGVSIGDTENAACYNSTDSSVLRDYSGHLYSCLSRKADSGFTVMVAIRWWNVYGSVVLVMIAFIILFGVCIAFIGSLIKRLIRWQEEVNRQLVQAAEMAENANRAKSQFLSQMSHEIRTPMNAILGLDSIALRDPDLSPRTRDELEKIGASAKHLLALINDILDMSRIESGRMDKLFDAFSQEDATSTNKYGGSGLGMAITKRMVDMMGGEILVESEKGVGSSFTVTIPLGLSFTEAAPEKEPEEKPAESTSVVGLHVLIAEDQEMNAEVLADLLEMEEISSEWAENGQVAVEMFSRSEAKHFDAILMDMRMPVMDGLAATRAIRKLDRGDAKTIPIIALTANAFEEDVQQCVQAGMNEHLSKPVDIDALVLTLGSLIDKGKE